MTSARAHRRSLNRIGLTHHLQFANRTVPVCMRGMTPLGDSCSSAARTLLATKFTSSHGTEVTLSELLGDEAYCRYDPILSM